MNPPYFESFVPRAGDINWPAVLTEFTLKSSLLILTGVCLNRWMVKASAALRFRLLWLSLLGVPVLLLSSFIRPQETVPLRYPVNVFDTSASPAGDQRTVTQNEPPVANVMPNPVSDNATLSAANSTTKPLRESSMLLVWLTGIFACALRMAVRLLRARRVSAKWTELKDGRLFQLLAGVSTQHGLSAVPRLLVSPEWIMPCTWGWRRPVIALPREAESWTGERLLHVLHHETGHIVRKDAPAHMLAFIALWPAWFNPLALAAKRQLSILREIACDDWVVTRGKANPLCYGTDLLALVKEHVLRSPAPHAPGLAVAQPSALAKRFRRLIQADVNRKAATARGKAALIAGRIGLTVGLSMVISCRAGAPVPMAPAPPAGSGSTETKISTKVSPEKARQGAKTIRYTLIEITVPDDDRSPSFLRPLLKEGGPDLIPFDSLRSLSQTKGTDLLKSGEAKEGQRLLWKAVKPFPYPSEFSGTGTPLKWDSAELGVSATFTGELTNGGRIVTARVSLNVKEFLGFIKHKLPSGSEVLQPEFRSRSFSDGELKIPNGGFVVLKNTPRQDAQSVEDVSWGGLVRKRWEERYTRYLAIGAECDPLPPAARGSGIPRAFPE